METLEHSFIFKNEMENKTRVSHGNPQQTKFKKHNFDNYFSGSSNKKVREINNFHPMASAVHGIFFVSEILSTKVM